MPRNSAALELAKRQNWIRGLGILASGGGLRGPGDTSKFRTLGPEGHAPCPDSGSWQDESAGTLLTLLAEYTELLSKNQS